MARGYGRMGCEDASLSDGSQIAEFNTGPPRFLRFLLQQRQSQQARMAFIHVEAFDRIMAQCAKHPQPADAKYDLLAKAIIGVAAIQSARQPAIPFPIFGNVRVQ